MDLDVGAQRAAELLNCLTVVTFTSNVTSRFTRYRADPDKVFKKIAPSCPKRVIYIYGTHGESTA